MMIQGFSSLIGYPEPPAPKQPPAVAKGDHERAPSPSISPSAREGSFKRLDDTPGRAAIVYLSFALVGIIAIHYSYAANQGYWRIVFGERGPVAESILLLIIALVTYWMRDALFPTEPSEVSSKTAPLLASIPPELRFQSHTREPRAFWGFCIFSMGLLIYFSILTHQQQYRYQPHWWYYLFWNIPLVFFLSCAFEVSYAVSTSYSRSSLKAHLPDTAGDKELYSLAAKLSQDTTDLVWSLGAIGFFFLAFKDFYLLLSTIIALAVLGAVILIAIFPWWFAYERAGELIEARCESMKQALDDCEKRKEALQSWSADLRECLAEIQYRKSEIGRMEQLREKFNVTSWLAERRKDFIPVTALNLLSPVIGAIGLPVFSKTLSYIFKLIGFSVAG